MKYFLLIFIFLCISIIKGISQEDVNPNGIRILDNSNPIRFSSSWTSFPDNALNKAEICNETNTYKTLMIVGNRSAGTERRVSVWDKLEVNGKLFVKSDILIGEISSSGISTASPLGISLGSTYGSNPVGSNLKLKLYENLDNEDYGLGISPSLFEIVAGQSGSIAFFTNGANERMRITADGRVGIGTSITKGSLTIGESSENKISNGELVIARSNGAGANRKFKIFLGDGTNNTPFYGLSIGDFGESSTDTYKAYFNILYESGNVLIGKASQINNSYKLDVEGPIRAHEIVVNTSGADFVFEPNYKLRSLNELEAFIKEYKHLPEIAQAKEMQENGVSAGEMQTKLLQKVEELTLYVIEKDKQLAEQMKINTEQQQLLQLMKERLEVLEKNNSVKK